MPTLSVNGCTYYYEDTGSGPETLVFGHGYLMTHRMWDAQVDAFASDYRCIRFDWRGQGQTQITDGGYDVPDLARDAAALIDALDAGPCHYVGLSMGGFVGFRLLVDHPEVLRSAALLDTSAEAEGTLQWIRYEAMIAAVERLGYDPIIRRVVPILFGPTFRREQPDAVDAWVQRIVEQDPTGIVRAGRGIFRREGVLHRLGQARTPTLLLTGADDVATRPERAATAHEALPNASLVLLPNAGHSSAVERPDAVNEHLRRFLAEAVVAA